MGQKVYVVSADTCREYGSRIYIFAICSTLEQALCEHKKVTVKNGFSKITEVELNKCQLLGTSVKTHEPSMQMPEGFSAVP